MLRNGHGARMSAALLVGLVLAAGCGMSEVNTDSTVAAKTPAAQTPANTAPPAAQPPPVGELAAPRLGRSATVRTSNGSYVVRNIGFNTGEGFGGSLALTGHYNGTLWNFELRYVSRLEVLGKIDAAEARTAPDNYFVREDIDLRRTFRTRLTKTDGAVVEFVVRINSINGDLEAGGPLQLSREELESLKSIDFF